MSLSRSLIALAGLTAMLVGAAPAHAQSSVQIGTLDCAMSGSIGVVITQRNLLRCAFIDTYGRVVDRYDGEIRDIGLAVGATNGGRLAWAVFAPSSGPDRGALAGGYVGATANASAIIGGGANILLGGSERSFALQPISVQGQIGLNVTAGIRTLHLAAR